MTVVIPVGPNRSRRWRPAAAPAAHSGDREQRDRPIVITPFGHRDRSEATLGGWGLPVELGLLSPRGRFEHDPVGVVQDAVADGIGQGSIGEVLMPQGRRELAGDDGRAGPVAVLEDLEQVAALLILGGGEAPVVDDQDVEAGELARR
jgi:hypothetical protein